MVTHNYYSEAVEVPFFFFWYVVDFDTVIVVTFVKYCIALALTSYWDISLVLIN